MFYVQIPLPTSKHGPQRPQKLSSHRTQIFSFPQPSEMVLLSNSRSQNRKERPNRSTNNGDMVEKAKYDVVSERVSSILLQTSRASKNG